MRYGQLTTVVQQLPFDEVIPMIVTKLKRDAYHERAIAARQRLMPPEGSTNPESYANRKS